MTDERRKTVVVAGGAGEVGEGIARSFHCAGFAVIVPSRSRERLDALAAAVGSGLDLIETDLSNTAAAQRFAEGAVERHGGVDAVVAALGGWTQPGSLLDMAPAAWNRVLENNLTSHLNAAQALAPLLVQTRGVYLMVNGGAADAPVPRYGAISIAAAAQVMMMRVLDQELASYGARAVTLLIDGIVNTRSRARTKPQWITADEVGHLAVLLVSCDAAPLAGRVVRGGAAAPACPARVRGLSPVSQRIRCWSPSCRC